MGGARGRRDRERGTAKGKRERGYRKKLSCEGRRDPRNRAAPLLPSSEVGAGPAVSFAALDDLAADTHGAGHAAAVPRGQARGPRGRARAGSGSRGFVGGFSLLAVVPSFSVGFAAVERPRAAMSNSSQTVRAGSLIRITRRGEATARTLVLLWTGPGSIPRANARRVNAHPICDLGNVPRGKVFVVGSILHS